MTDVTDLRNAVEPEPGFATASENLPNPESISLASRPDLIRETITDEYDSLPSWFEAVPWLRSHQAGASHSPHSPRFSATWIRRVKAKMFQGDRAVRNRFEDPQGVLITFAGSPLIDDQVWLPPVDYLHHLDASREARQQALRRVLDGVDFEWVAILGAHQDGVRRGYGHVHVFVMVDVADGPVTEEQFEPVVQSHLSNCDVTSSDEMGAHSVVVSSIDVDELVAPTEYPDREPTNKATNYLAGHLPNTTPGMSMNWADELHATAVLASEQRMLRTSHGWRNSITGNR